MALATCAKMQLPMLTSIMDTGREEPPRAPLLTAGSRLGDSIVGQESQEIRKTS